MPTDLKPRTGDANGRLWGAHASDWAEIQEGMARPAYEAVMEHTRVGPGTRYLDVGCGAGMAAQFAAARGALVSGIDAAEALLEIARQRTPGGDFRRGDLEELPFDDQSFDVVTGFNSFQYAGNPAVALSAARRVTKPRRRAVVIIDLGQSRRHGGGGAGGSPASVDAAASLPPARPRTFCAFRRAGPA